MRLRAHSLLALMMILALGVAGVALGATAFGATGRRAAARRAANENRGVRQTRHPAKRHPVMQKRHAAKQHRPAKHRPAPVPHPAVQVWETSGDETQLIAPQAGLRFASTVAPAAANITVDDSEQYQTMSGFGAAMTDSAGYVLMHMSSAQRAAVMANLFGPGPGIGIDYLRVPIGASDFSTSNYTEDDVVGSDPKLTHFSIAHDLQNIVPALRQALAINPHIQILATPWTAPAWMKTSHSLIGGSLSTGDVDVYAAYLVKFVQAYAAQGIPVTALTVENEPDYSPSSYPGMLLSASEEGEVITALGHDLAAAGLHTQILGLDSDWSDSAYALSLLGDPSVAPYLAGTAFHCYAGDPSAQLAVQSADPSKGIYETECTGYEEYPSFSGDLVNDTRTLVIDGVRDWSKTVVLWNLALNELFGPTNGGCEDCVPNVTVNSVSGDATYNVEYYLLGQVSRFVAAGARRIASTSPAGGLQSVAFENPNHDRVLVVLNPTAKPVSFTVTWDKQSFAESIPTASVQTFVWP